jgi:hypothetical protein
MREVTITLDRLVKAEIDTLIASLEVHTCQEYYGKFERLFIQAKEEGNTELQEVYSLLGRIASMDLKSRDDSNPLSPMYILSDGSRGMIPDDLSEPTIDIFIEFYPKLKDAEFKARIADILWLRRRKPIFATDAVEAYLASANNLSCNHDWSLCTERTERALRLSHQCRKNQPELFAKIVKYMEETILEERNLTLSFKFLDLLADFKAGDIQACFNRAWNMAKTEQGWQLAEKWVRLLKDKEKINIAMTNRAEFFAGKAMIMDQGLRSADLMRQAITIYQKIPKSQNRREELYQQLRDFQRNSTQQMQIISHEINLADGLKQANQVIIGNSLQEDLFSLAFSVTKPIAYNDLKRSENEKPSFWRLFGTIYTDRNGLVVDQACAKNEDVLQDEILSPDILFSASIFHQVMVMKSIEPARQRIVLKHDISDESFFHYVTNNPFIPAGHEYLFSKGLYAGLIGDFTTALSILVPQIENAFRYVLQENGEETTTLKNHQAQEYILLSSILSNDKFKEIFGEDLTLDLQALLISRKYANLRHKIAHGVMSTKDFFQPAGIYLWWLILRMVLTPKYPVFSAPRIVTELSDDTV